MPRQPLIFQEPRVEITTSMMYPEGEAEAAHTGHWIQAIRATMDHNSPGCIAPTFIPEMEANSFHWVQGVCEALRQYYQLMMSVASRIWPLPCFRDRTEILEPGPQQNSRPARLQIRRRLPAQRFDTMIHNGVPSSYNYPNLIVRERLPHSVNRYQHSRPYGTTLLNNDNSSITQLILENSSRLSAELLIFTNSQWAELLQEKNDSRTQNFLQFLEKLALHHRSYPQEKLVDRLKIVCETVKRDKKLWDEVLMEAEEGASTCEDRALYYFSSMENRCLIYRLLNGEPVDDKKMLEIMRSLYRREKLQQNVSQLIAEEGERLLAVHQQIQEPIDEIEVQLYFETKLKELLGLPGKDLHMRFEAIGKVQCQFLEQVAENLLQDEQVDPLELRDYITNNSYWQEYVEKKLHDELAAILKQNSQFLEQLDEKSARGEISSQAYLEKSKELMKNYQEACDNLVKNRSQTILQRLC